ncbi:sugar ABC transporter substrate-binding protein [Candidatus Atribacteria bacterium RBG_19FT_COMBO_35_14]|uniref:Sugar ABC transporter substrate-binding protein n=1 Tax=Candidatus Sediminicultor quintus TaxID=1797291 RepID=A0A1F5A854_9BACT|nr:MAG: sugar ABC transporter substrate-binding protein [Candidatus Atribacteria bacterium RBG_19FT_COMBO_35_14]
MKNLSVLLLVLILLIIGGISSFVSADPLVIGITQIVEHPAIDAARDGFIEGLEEAGFKAGEDVVYDLQNAQGDFNNAISIAQKFKDDKVDLIVAISTPSAQAALQVNQEIPIIINAVTDPVAANLAKSWESSGNNVTGMSDAAPNKQQVELIPRFLPEAKNVGTIYNAGEANSVVQIEVAKAACKELGLNLIEVSVSNSSEVLMAAQSLAGRVEAIYIVTDNTVVSALESVINVCNQEKIALIVADPSSVDKGALASYGIDYFSLGKRSAEIALKVIKGVKPSDIPIQTITDPNDLQFVVNLDTAKIIGISVSEEIIKAADKIIKDGKVQGD